MAVNPADDLVPLELFAPTAAASTAAEDDTASNIEPDDDFVPIELFAPVPAPSVDIVAAGDACSEEPEQAEVEAEAEAEPELAPDPEREPQREPEPAYFEEPAAEAAQEAEPACFEEPVAAAAPADDPIDDSQLAGITPDDIAAMSTATADVTYEVAPQELQMAVEPLPAATPEVAAPPVAALPIAAPPVATLPIAAPPVAALPIAAPPVATPVAATVLEPVAAAPPTLREIPAYSIPAKRPAIYHAAPPHAPSPTMVWPKPFPVAPPIPRLNFATPPPVQEPRPVAEPPVAEHVTPPTPPAAVKPTSPSAGKPTPAAGIKPPPKRPASPPSARMSEQPAYVAGMPLDLQAFDQLLRHTASRGAATLYLSSNARPSIRVDGKMKVLEDVPVVIPREMESLLVALMLTRDGESLVSLAASGWTVERAGIGRVRCMSFEDQRGPGAVFRIVPARAVAPDQLGLSLEIQSLTVEPEGLVIIAGPRASGKRTVIGGLLDLINRTRRAHVISVEREVDGLSESDSALISRREVRGGLDEILTGARAALRENPDILVLQEIRSAPLMNLALDAAASGQLVIAGFTAPSATAAIQQILNLFSPESRRQAQLALSLHLRAVIGQVLLEKTGGGRVPAREVVLNTQAFARVLAEGKVNQLQVAIEAGRHQGMVSLDDALLELVRGGMVDPADACGQSLDPTRFAESLKREGIERQP